MEPRGPPRVSDVYKPLFRPQDNYSHLLFWLLFMENSEAGERTKRTMIWTQRDLSLTQYVALTVSLTSSGKAPPGIQVGLQTYSPPTPPH